MALDLLTSDLFLTLTGETESSEEDEEEGDADEKADENGNDAENKEAKAEDAEKVAQIAADEELAKSLAEEDIANDTIPAAGASAGSSCSSAVVGGSSSQSVGSSAAEPTPSSSTGTTAADPAEEEEDAEPSSFECAWELLCLARDVFKRQIEYKAENLAGGENKWKESKMKLAEALQTLGEISIEWENNEAALDLLQESLSLRKESLTSDDRLIAETYVFSPRFWYFQIAFNIFRPLLIHSGHLIYLLAQFCINFWYVGTITLESLIPSWMNRKEQTIVSVQPWMW